MACVCFVATVGFLHIKMPGACAVLQPQGRLYLPLAAPATASKQWLTVALTRARRVHAVPRVTRESVRHAA